LPFHQIAIASIIVAMLALFVWERVRYDLVASFALLAAVASGCVPPDKAFSGFSNPVVVVIASILVVSRGVQRSGVFELGVRRLLRNVRSTDARVGLLTGAVTFLSAAMKNVGALGLFLPIALQTAARAEDPPSVYLMPLAFGSLIGGAITLVGTSPNLLISAVRREVEGRPFAMFDFTPVALPLSCVAVLFLAFGWRLLPRDRRGRRSADQLFDLEKYTTELRVKPESPLVGRSVRS
jgi:di/tricarboxylate transporter